MTTFDRREQSFENKFAHDGELRFKAEARRNKMLATWLVEKLGKPTADAEVYFKELMATDLREDGDSDVLHKLSNDLEKGGVKISSHQIRRAMDEFLAKAVEEIKTGH